MAVVYDSKDWVSTDEADVYLDDVEHHGVTDERGAVAMDLAEQYASQINSIWRADLLSQYLKNALLSAETIDKLIDALPSEDQAHYKRMQDDTSRAVKVGAMCSALNDASVKKGELRKVDAWGVRDTYQISRAVSEAITASQVRIHASSLYELPYQDLLPAEQRERIMRGEDDIADIAGYIGPYDGDCYPRDMHPWERMISFPELDRESGPGSWTITQTTQPIKLLNVGNFVNGIGLKDESRDLTWKQFVEHVMPPRVSETDTGRFNLIEAILVCRRTLAHCTHKRRDRVNTVEEGIFFNCPNNHPYATVVNVQRGGELYKIAELVCGIFNEVAALSTCTMEPFTPEDLKASVAAIALVSKSSPCSTEKIASLYNGNRSAEIRCDGRDACHIGTVARFNFDTDIDASSSRADSNWVYTGTNRQAMMAEKLERLSVECPTGMQPRVSGKTPLISPPSVSRTPVPPCEQDRDNNVTRINGNSRVWAACAPYQERAKQGDQRRHGRWPTKNSPTRGGAVEQDKWHSRR